ncbi:MAG: metallophosphoesterase [Deltaproteobacteria bacterium]|nr:metallophosphoesterase [Deltaproteobacteria bacterium]
MKRTALVLVLGAVVATFLLASRPPDAAPAPGPLSLLVLGDTGQPIGGPLAALRPQHQVARALVAEDESAEVHGLVLLGDNFYPDGIEDDELKDRMRANVVAPYCRFLTFTSRGRGSLEESCGVAEAYRHPVPLYAVLGNHDYGERESPQLQKEVVPEYIKSWRMPDQVDVHELPGGVSLIPFQSMPLVRGKNEGQLVRALRRSKGPFRILAAHHPIADPGNGHDPKYSRRVRSAIAQAGVPVHLFLGGHEHNLQVIAGDGKGDAALHVISGAGSDTRKVKPSSRKRLFGAESLGFARVDRVEAAGEPILRVTMFTVPSTPGLGREVSARFEVGLDGDIREVVSDAE